MRRRFRYLTLAIFALLSISCIFLFPRITINEDMTEYLPSDSRMRAGLDTLENYFPEIDMNAYIVKAMFCNVSDSDSLGRRLCEYDGISGIRAREEKDGFVLYQLTVEANADPKASAELIRSDFGESVLVETNANSNMPDNMVAVLLIGVILVFGILFLMCSSYVEALLFIVTIGFAVLANMGTNAFLPSVSMMTNTIGAVLQLVLSMDYSIILMNRYRQVLKQEPEKFRAMSLAVKSASNSILSSSFTTIVGLLALVFMKFKIGLDLGIVLAKGVFCSLISIYTILPGLILLFNKAIRATEKKVLLLPTNQLAGFEMKFHIPLSVLFVVLFISSALISGRTELSYASIWDSDIAKVFKPQNMFSLLYRTEDEQEIADICKCIEKDEGTLSVLSYPSLLKQRLTAGEMADEITSLLNLMPSSPGKQIQLDTSLRSENILRILYYACTHPQRDERMSIEQMISAIPSEMKGMISSFDIPDFNFETETEIETEPSLQFESQPAEPAPVSEPQPDSEIPTDSEIPPVAELEQVADQTDAEVDLDTLMKKYHFTKENCNAQLNAAELADFLGFSHSQASTIYSMAGHKGKKGTMSPYEFIVYMTGTVVNNRLLRKMISDSQVEGLMEIQNEMEYVINLSENTKADAAVIVESVTVEENADVNEIVVEEKAVVADIVQPASTEPAIKINPVINETFTVDELYETVSTMGIEGVDRGMLELLFILCGSQYEYDEQTALSVEELVAFLCNEVATDEKYSLFIDQNTRSMLGDLEDMLSQGAGALRKEKWSMAAIVTNYDLEAPNTYGFLDRMQKLCDERLFDNYYLIGESVMYREMKDGFRKELLILTLLTVISIFLIVALTFRSLLIPLILVMTVMTGVFVNVIVSGLNGGTMLYLAYLIVQSILMGATIDYGILFTNYYLERRRAGLNVAGSIKEAYMGSIHTILTSGLIIVSAPYIMSVLLSDPMLSSILSSLTFGAIATLTLILFILPATLATCDKLIMPRNHRS